MSFLPEKYKTPNTSNYMKFLEGKNKFRVLSSAITGFEYWNTENKPVRSPEMFEETPTDIKIDKEGKYRINHFWAFVVYNYEAKRVQILQLTQKGIMSAIKNYVDEPDWGDPKGYDFVVTRSGSRLDTEYQVIANPHSPAPEEAKAPKVNLEVLFEGKDPFALNE